MQDNLYNYFTTVKYSPILYASDRIFSCCSDSYFYHFITKRFVRRHTTDDTI